MLIETDNYIQQLNAAIIKEALLGVLGKRGNWQNNFRDKG